MAAPRIRTVKPEIWSSPRVMNLSIAGRLTFFGLITQADDEGRESADPRKVRAAIFPGDDMTLVRVRELMEEVAREALIVLYEPPEHGPLYAIPGWKRHQRIDKPKPSAYPPPPDPCPNSDPALVHGRIHDGSEMRHGGVVEASATHLAGSDRKGKEWKGEEGIGPAMSDADAPDCGELQPEPANNTADDWGPTAEDLPHVPAERRELAALDGGRSGAVGRVFDHWRGMHNHPRAQLDAKRERVIREALKLYSEADLCLAITGYRNSPHHMGQNDRGTVYDDIALLLRDAAHIETGIRYHDDPPRTGGRNSGPTRFEVLQARAKEGL